MKLPRFQFTLRQLIKLVAVSAIFFALIRTLLGLFLVATGLIMCAGISIGIYFMVIIIKKLEILLRDKPLTDVSCGSIVWRSLDNPSPGRASGGHEPWHSPGSHSHSDRVSG